MDTPLDSPARIRFQKYRGLKSFRTSPWDPKENLPANYARIFQFQNFKRTEKKIRKDLQEKIGVSVSIFVVCIAIISLRICEQKYIYVNKIPIS